MSLNELNISANLQLFLLLPLPFYLQQLLFVTSSFFVSNFFSSLQ